MYFSFDLSPLSIVFFALAFISCIYVCLRYCNIANKVRITKKMCDKQPFSVNESDLPYASVIIYARNESEALQRNLPPILQQQYPAGFEVIVVNEGSSEETNMVVGSLKTIYPNLYLTYTPDGARSLSRKKLALTIGVKAAKGDVVVITDANAIIKSKNWLSSLLADFTNPSISIVLGYGAPSFPSTHMAGRLTRIFDIVSDNISWIYSAMIGRTYRACGYNLAYRRTLFFDNKGFSSSLNLREGDDDIFVSEIARGRNVAIALSDDAMVEKETMPFMRETHASRISHAFTGRNLSKLVRRSICLGEWCIILTAIFVALGLIFSGIENLFAIIISAILLLTVLIVVSIVWHQTLRAFHAPNIACALPFQAATRPFRNIAVSILTRLRGASHYTWS